jgi:ArsR family transcriptional regulator
MEVASRLRGLANPARAKLVSLLLSDPTGEAFDGVLAASIRLPEATVGHHLGELRRAGLIESQRRGMNVYHRPCREALSALFSTFD